MGDTPTPPTADAYGGYPHAPPLRMLMGDTPLRMLMGDTPTPPTADAYGGYPTADAYGGYPLRMLMVLYIRVRPPFLSLCFIYF